MFDRVKFLFEFCFKTARCVASRNFLVLVKVLSDPPQSFSVSLPLKDWAHEKFKRSSVKFAPRDFALACCLAVEAESLPKFFFWASARPIDFIAQDQDGTVRKLQEKSKFKLTIKSS